MASATSASDALASMTAQRPGSAAAIARKLRAGSGEIEGPRLRNDRSVSPGARRRAARLSPSSAGRSRIRVRSGRRSPNATRSERIEDARINRARPALIGARRIGKTVGDDPFSGPERRLDGVVDMIDPRRREKNRLGRRTQRLDDARQKDLAQNLGALASRPARASRSPRSRPRPGAAADGRSGSDLPAPSPPSSVISFPRGRAAPAPAFVWGPLIGWRRISSRIYCRHISETGRPHIQARRPSRGAGAIRPRPRRRSSTAKSSTCVEPRLIFSRATCWPASTGAISGPS